MRFLIVDDADAPLNDLRRLLAELGQEVVGTARNGVEAVNAYERLQPDVLIMDVIMPRMNGLDALRTIREAHPRACIVMASSLQSCQTALEAERLGALYCLAKPYNGRRLRTVVERIAKDLRKAARSSRTAAVRLAGLRSPA